MAYHYRWPGVIRDALLADGRGLWAVAKVAEINYPNLAKFAEGKAGLSLDSAERLATVLGLGLTPANRLPAQEVQTVAPKATGRAVAVPAPQPLRRPLSLAQRNARIKLGMPVDD